MNPTRRVLLRLTHGLLLALCLVTAALAQPSTVSGESRASADPEDAFYLNLTDSDIGTLITTVSEQTGLNFVVDPRVKGKVTVISAKPMDPDELYQVFLSILQVHGFAVVPSGEVIKIVPDADAKQSTIRNEAEDTSTRGDELVTRIISLAHVDAAQIVALLRPLVPQQAHLAAYAPSNTLIFSDRSGNIDRLMQIIGQIDRPSDEELEIIPIVNTEAAQIEKTVKTLLGGAGAGAQGGAGKVPTIVSDEWTNSILMNGDKAQRLRIRTLISHLDTPRDDLGLVTRVVRLQEADAATVANLITPLTDPSTAGARSTTPGTPKASAAGAAQVGVTVQIDENAQLLVLRGPEQELGPILTLIKDLDRPRAQVLVEAMIAEAATDKLGELGFQWRLPTNPASGFGIVGGLNLGGQSPSINSALSNPLELGNGLGLGLSNGVTNVLGTEIVNFTVLLRALTGDAVTNILSAPNVVVRDNEEAEIVVGQNVPFLTGQFTSTGGGSTPTNPFQTIERQDIGLTLKVKPRVTDSGVVHLEIAQEVSSVTSTSVTGAADLVTNKRSISTKVSVMNGNIVVLGGLIDDTVQETEQGVPGLVDIPVVGGLFRGSQSTSVKRNLMIFIRPVVLRRQEDIETASRDKYERMRIVQDNVNATGLRQLPGESMPRLPDFTNPGGFAIPGEPRNSASYQWWQSGFSR